jgi:hypothetical protein
LYDIIGRNLKANPLALFFYALKAPEINRQYPRRFKVFLAFKPREGTFEKQEVVRLLLAGCLDIILYKKSTVVVV